MNAAITLLMFVAGIFLAVLLWFRIRPDPVGSRLRTAKERAGIHGRVDEWLYWRADVGKPAVANATERGTDPPDNPWLRAVQAVVREEAHRSGLEPAAARDALLARQSTVLARSFLLGRVHTAIRSHLRARYRGPRGLFDLWLYVVAYPRYGRRYLFLDTLAHALQEIRTP